MSRPGSHHMSGGGMVYRDFQHRRTPQIIAAQPHYATMVRGQTLDTHGSRSPLHGSHSPLNGSHMQLNGSHSQLYGSHPQLHGSQSMPFNGGHPQSVGGQLQTTMNRPQIVVGHPQGHLQLNGGHPNGSYPQVNGGQGVPQESDQNRALREAFRKERKIESYLADDLNFPMFAQKLKGMGLQLRDIPADGNCLFRALGDQLAGHCRHHYRHRQEVVQYMMDHRKDFEPFVEDDVPFDDHINNLKKLGTHAGNDAIVAFARLHNVNVFIHQLRGDPLQISGPSSSANVRQVHIAYHNGDHYSSVRRDGDNTESPANIKIQENNQTEVPPKPLLPKDCGVVTAKRDLSHLEAEVTRATGCQDVVAVREALMKHTYDVDATISSLMQTLDLNGGTQVGDDTASVGSYQTTDSGIWAANGPSGIIVGGGSSSRSPGKSKGQKVHFREDSYGGSSGYSSMGSNRGGGTRPKLLIPSTPVQYHIVTGRKAKELKKLEKKKRI